MTSSHEQRIAACYASWGKDYHDEYYGEKAPYPPVHRDILLRLLTEHKATHILDAGCGSASILRYLADGQRELFGFDLTPEMVAEGKRIFAQMRINPERLWLGSVTEPASFVMPGATDALPCYNAIICSGVMPHIRQEDESVVLENLTAALKPQGLLLLEARNELFALFTQNRYTSQFLRTRCMEEEDLLSKAGENATALRHALDQFSSLMRLDLPPLREGKAGGYDQVLSRTHNPLELVPRLEKLGFTKVRLHFYHYHCLPPMLAQVAPEFFHTQSCAMEKPDDWRGYFMASAFIISGVRT